MAAIKIRATSKLEHFFFFFFFFQEERLPESFDEDIPGS